MAIVDRIAVCDAYLESWCGNVGWIRDLGIWDRIVVWEFSLDCGVEFAHRIVVWDIGMESQCRNYTCNRVVAIWDGSVLWKLDGLVMW